MNLIKVFFFCLLHFNYTVFTNHAEINELYLFHGTKQKYVEAIRTTGFDERVSSTGLFGTGIYFAENSSKSDEYVVPGQDNVYPFFHSILYSLLLVILILLLLLIVRRYCYMFICRVCLGTPYRTGKPQQELRRPPCLLEDTTACAHPRFDSLIGLKSSDSQKSFLQKYREFIVYDRNQCYPEFLVTYRRETKSESAERIQRQREEDEREAKRKAEEEEQRKRWEEEVLKRKEEEEKRRLEEEENQRKQEEEKKRVREELRRIIEEQTSEERYYYFVLF